jgi:ribose/xylose/arabinose/galactoside ABC-type transport system permease subunit
MVAAVVLALAVGLAVGLANGLFVAKWHLPDFVVTLGTMSIANGIMFLYTNGREVGSVYRGFAYLSEGSIGPVPVSALVWASVAVLAAVWLRHSRTGRHVYAVGGNPEVARLSGISVSSVRVLVYALSGLAAALAGVVLTARLGVGYPLAGEALQLDSIASVVIGGTSLFGGRGGVAGTVGGVLIVSVLSNLFNLAGVSSFAQQLLKGFVIIAVVVIRTRGER